MTWNKKKFLVFYNICKLLSDFINELLWNKFDPPLIWIDLETNAYIIKMSLIFHSFKVFFFTNGFAQLFLTFGNFGWAFQRKEKSISESYTIIGARCKEICIWCWHLCGISNKLWIYEHYWNLSDIQIYWVCGKAFEYAIWMSIDGVNVKWRVGLHTFFFGILDVCNVSTYGLRPSVFQRAHEVEVPKLVKLNIKHNIGRSICIAKKGYTSVFRCAHYPKNKYKNASYSSLLKFFFLISSFIVLICYSKSSLREHIMPLLKQLVLSPKWKHKRDKKGKICIILPL